MDPAGVERDTQALARRIAELGDGQRSKVFRMSWWSDRMMDWAMSRPAFKTQLFRFVDVFPALDGREDIARHLAEYFDGVDIPKALDLGVDLADKVPFGAAIEARVARKNIARMAEQFIVGSTPAEAVAGLHGLWRTGSAATVDLLGEKTVVAREADRYQARVLELLEALCTASPSWAPDDLLERDDLGPLPRVNVSIKPTALATHYEPLSRSEGIGSAKERIRPILRFARDRGAHVHFDMEHYDAKALTVALFRELLSEDEFADVAAGIVIQAYLRDSRDDLADLIAWSSGRATPITVRLVKGAYWDAETVHARASGWTPPVFAEKEETDANYERCARLLQDHHGEVRAAFGSHNLRSLAYAVSYGRHRGVPDHGYEVQLLYGMAEPVHAAIKRLGLRLRVYGPVGELVPGMAYLVRRLLENTSNESFVRHRFAEGRDLDELVAPPRVDDIPGPTDAPVVGETPPSHPPPYAPEPLRAPPSRWPSSACGPTWACTSQRCWRGSRCAPRPPSPPSTRRRPTGWWPPPPLAPPPMRTRRWRPRWPPRRRGGGPRRRSEPGCCSGPLTGCASAATSSPPSNASRRPSHGTRPMATSARPSTSASTTAARCCAWPARRRSSCSHRPVRRTG